MNNKKILFVISSLKIWWGAERVVSLIWTKLFEKWYGVSYLTFYKHNDLYDFKWKYDCLNERFSINIFVSDGSYFIYFLTINQTLIRSNPITISTISNPIYFETNNTIPRITQTKPKNKNISSITDLNNILLKL